MAKKYGIKVTHPGGISAPGWLVNMKTCKPMLFTSIKAGKKALEEYKENAKSYTWRAEVEVAEYEEVKES